METSTNTLLLTNEERIAVVRYHFERKGYRVHSGLQFGCELVLYADDPDRVHSDFCVHVVRSDTTVDWRMVQTLVRSMPDLHKTLILANVRNKFADEGDGEDDECPYVVDELAIATEHAPFRHKKKQIEVGSQVKKSVAQTTDRK
mmetsp:Transcript_10468/g.15220  ORF Transcript_10468/g.15220 Transcript_10468/m.15220 type:complete len:145 (+) Transcript_10468:90-524(+)